MSDDFDFEPIPGLPAVPPQGERILWQGKPEWRGLAVRAFHVRKVAIYFAVLVAWRGVTAHADGMAVAAASRQMALIGLLGLGCMAVLTLLAWAYSRSTVYTITSRRIVIRSGVALPLTVNIPFAEIESAAVKLRRDGTGDLPVAIAPGKRIAVLALWPNWRPWRFTRPEPMLRAVARPQAVAQLLAGALRGEAVQPLPAPTVETSAPAAPLAHPATS